MITPKTSSKSKEVAAATKSTGLPDGPTAVVGLKKLQKAVAQLFGRGSHYFDSLEQANEWPVKEEKKRRKRRTTLSRPWLYMALIDIGV